MAQAVIGALRVNLGLDSANFEKGAGKAEKRLADMRKRFAAVAAAAAAAGAAIVAAAFKGASEIDRQAKAARRLGASIGAFRALEVASSEAGVSLSGLTNDIQNIDREIANIGTSGNADRALEQLGIRADELSGLDADEKLATIADRIRALGLSTGETTALLRDLGVRNREMTLLMLQGGDAIRAARSDVEEYGLALSSVDAAAIEQANDRIGRLSIVAEYATQQLALKLVPAFGQLALAITESMREGGALRTVIDGVIGNLDRLAAYVATIVTAFGVRYVAALAAARLATLTLAGALATLRTAIVRTGIGVLVIGAGEAVLQFGKLVSATGSVGGALEALRRVAIEVWERIGDGTVYVVKSVEAMSANMEAAFIKGIGRIAGKWVEFTQTVADGINSLFGTNLTGASAVVTQELQAAYMAASDAATNAGNAAAAAADRFAAPLNSLQDLRDRVAEVGDTNDRTADATDRMTEALERADEAAAGGSGAGGRGKGALAEEADEITDAMREAQARAEEASTRIRDSMTDSFKGILTGANSLRDGLSNVFGQIGDMMLTNVGNHLFGGIAGRIAGAVTGNIPGFANGTNSAPGGLAWVGERGRELVNLPRGSQVTPNHKLPDIGAATAPAPTFNIDARGADQGAVDRIGAALDKFQRDFAKNVHGTLRASGNAGITRPVVR